MSIALDDQAQAAAEHALSILEQVDVVAREIGAHRGRSDGGPFTALLRRHLAAEAAAHRLRRCSHLRGRGPAPALYLPADPRRLRCLPCGTSRVLNLGVDEALACDRCRSRALDGTGVIAVEGAVLIAAWLCKPCLHAEHAPRQEAS